MQAFELLTDSKLDGPSPILSDGVTMASKKEFQILIHLTPKQFSILPQTILDQLWLREDDGVSGSCSHIISSLHEVFCSLSQIGEPLPIFASEKLCLAEMLLLYQSCC